MVKIIELRRGSEGGRDQWRIEVVESNRDDTSRVN